MTVPTTCTIIARNYLAHARTLARSFAERHPGERLHVLVIDDLDHRPGDSAKEPFDQISLLELPLPLRTLHEMAMCYRLMELATALKPTLMRLMLERSAGGAVLYLDPDVLVLGPLDEIGPLADKHRIVLTPHTTSPMPRDDRRPAETEILASGVYNLGFLALAGGCEPFLDWWEDRVRRDALSAPAEMLFTDQRWVDLGAPYFDVHLLVDPGYNLAYWNADQRPITENGEGYLAGGSPLRFVHFSGFDPLSPHLLSKHQGDRPRVLLSDQPVLAALCRRYADALLAEGYSSSIGTEYLWSRLPDGTPIDSRMRAAYRTGLIETDLHGAERPPDPFEPGSVASLVEWLCSPDPLLRGVPLMPRYLWAIYAGRADVARAYPLIRTTDEEGFRGWLRHFGSKEEPVPELLLPLVRGDIEWGFQRPKPALPYHLRAGIVLAGYLRAELGIGEAARLALRALEASSIRVSSVDFGCTDSRQQHDEPPSLTRSPSLDTNLVWVNGDQLPGFACMVGPEYFAGRYTVVNWAWETEQLPPSMAESADLCDEIWVPSEYSRAAVASSVSDRPIYVFRHPILRPQIDRDYTNAELGMPEGFVFMFAFDHLSCLARKNPLGLVEAYRRAFRPDEGPRLVLKSVNSDLRVLDAERVRLAIADRPDITLIESYVTAGKLTAMIERCDCYVSLHRAEGFGLTIAEAMALGRPVVATGYSGNLEFMDESTGYLVPYSMTEVPPGADPYTAGDRWAEPDIEAAAETLRRVYCDQAEASQRAERAHQVVADRHGLERAVTFLETRFEAITARRRDGYRSQVADAVRRRLG